MFYFSIKIYIILKQTYILFLSIDLFILLLHSIFHYNIILRQDLLCQIIIRYYT